MSDWKPGDVAVAKYEGGPPKVYLRQREFGTDVDRWVSEEGTTSSAFEMAEWSRRLVVIDPADNPHRPGSAEWADWIEDQYSEQTRPRVIEPGGIGAVVKDDLDVLWVSTAHGGPARWIRARYVENEDPRSVWSAIRAREVLSEGVTP